MDSVFEVRYFLVLEIILIFHWGIEVILKVPYAISEIFNSFKVEKHTSLRNPNSPI